MKIALVAILLCLALTARAQDEVIVLSPFEISSARATEKPPIVVKKRADYLLLQISLVNDTREPERRRDEVYATLSGMVTGVPRGSKIELFTEEFTLNPGHYQIPLNDVSEKRDTSRVTLYAKIPLSESDDVGALAEALRSFVRSIRGDGRTEVFTGDLGLSIRNPERYRYDVIQAIAADVKRLREMFGEGFEIVVKGLDARLKWERSSVSEVELYLPFAYEVFPIRGSTVITER
ncbi:hypothetical protein [Opitutus terrae]|uniref:Uncharacterized protein n=1 Tax=Opitutus terrae (strain DSM 11246 / JCM 15787 / PB90-1) TaxID=452637 RepID=B1ZQX7_OPITP|nr:hypothetical protein [Opitutus terrae]ACB73644.1 hypothetical protein Oter_0354 [Opitutus terrae PB90-1]